MLWVLIPLRRGVFDTTLCYEICQWLAPGLWFSPGTTDFLHQSNLPPRYNWNSVESGVKHYNPTQTLKLNIHYDIQYKYKTDCHEITEILLKVTLTTITLTLALNWTLSNLGFMSSPIVWGIRTTSFIRYHHSPKIWKPNNF
jgi:hypothetical protein